MQRRKASVNFLDSLKEAPCLNQPTPDPCIGSQRVVTDRGNMHSTSLLEKHSSATTSSSNHGKAECATLSSSPHPEGVLLLRAATSIACSSCHVSLPIVADCINRHLQRKCCGPLQSVTPL